MALPEQPLLRGAFQLYFRRIMPWIGRVISKHTTAYSWLPESARVFPAPAELARRMRDRGFTRVSYELFMGGVCAMHVGTKSER
jgi:demethylmenaquinone methyltransferase / 2-methoxy-6-polyprenyl-1,4-benzoquinol methylase